MGRWSLLVGVLLALALGCASKRYDPIMGAPKLDFCRTPRLVNVGQPLYLDVYWWGALPSKDQYLMYVIKVFGEERLISVGTLHGRLVPGGSSRFVLRFTIKDYYEASGRLKGEGFGTRVIPQWEMNPEDQQDAQLRIELEIYEAVKTNEQTRLVPGWKRGKCWAKKSHEVRLSCRECTY